MTGTGKPKSTNISRPADLMDFHLRWPDFRSEALKVSEDQRLDVNARETIAWLVAMADRVGMGDLI